MDAGITRIFSWSALEKYVYYAIEKVEFMDSMFSPVLAPVVTINGVRYYFPIGKLSILNHFKDDNFIIYPGEKSIFAKK